MYSPQAQIAARQAQRATEAGFVTIPEGWTVSDLGMCRSCKAEILWCVTPKGHRAPLNRDGTSHFSDCPDAQSWRKR